MKSKTGFIVGSAMAIGGVMAFLLVVVPLHLAQPNYDAKSQLMSELALGPYGWTMLIAFTGLAVSCVGVALIVWSGNGSSFLGGIFCLAAILFLLAGIFPLGRHDAVHIEAIAGAFVAGVLGIFLFSSYSGRMAALMPKHLSIALASGVALSVLLGQSMVEMGIAQRLAAACLFLWFLSVGWKGCRGGRGHRNKLKEPGPI